MLALPKSQFIPFLNLSCSKTTHSPRFLLLLLVLHIIDYLLTFARLVPMALENTVGLNGHSSDGTHESKSDMIQEEFGIVTEQSDMSGGEDDIIYIQGPRFWFICASLVEPINPLNRYLPSY